MLRNTTLLFVAMTLAAPVFAKDKLITLTAEDASLLQGKTLAVTHHNRPSFVAMTGGKAIFGMLGVAAMISAGNKLVDEKGIADPAILMREQLAGALRDGYGLVPQPVDTTPTEAKKPAELAKLHPEADYVLDVRSAGWNYAYYPTKFATYWVGYSVQVQLIDAKTGRQVSNAACNTNTNKHANPPSGDALLANDAQLLKDVTQGLGWTCVQLLAREQFKLADDKIAATPDSYKDPLAAYAAQSHAPATPEAAPLPAPATEAPAPTTPQP